MVSATSDQRVAYGLGHSADELERLIDQSRFYGDLTAHVLQLAGLKTGMRVLDVGSGAGDVSFLAARLVGPEGTVTGVDRSPDAIRFATQRATQAGLTNVQFRLGNLTEYTPAEPVDAVIGRFVLAYLTDPAAVLRRLARFLTPGGIVVFHEMDLDGTKSVPSCELFETTLQLVKQTLTLVGADLLTSLKLSGIFQNAGLPAPHMILHARVEGGGQGQAPDQLTQITRTLLPHMERAGITSADEVGIETLESRLRQEADALDATIVSPSLIGAWSRKA